MSDLSEAALLLHAELRGKIRYELKRPLEAPSDLSLLYTPGVAAACLEIAAEREKVFAYTGKGNLVAIITDGTAVLGLGDIGPEAALPVMEGKAILFKRFGKVDCIPICLDTKEVDEIVETIFRIAPGFGGINLEDISAPRCFEIEAKLQSRLDIPVFHDDQHGTAVVCLAALKNALRIVGKKMSEIKIVTSGSGAAGIAITKLLLAVGATNITLCDSKGIISRKRTDLNSVKASFLPLTNPDDLSGSLSEALAGADVFIGVSAPDIVSATDVSRMNTNAIVFSMSNPTPEIMPEEARRGGATVIATGRSDYPNQVNNVLAFPGLFRGILDSGARQFTERMFLAAADALANLVPDPIPEKIIPAVFDPGVAEAVAEAVRKVAGE